jgi:hypothetical protein
MKEELTPEEILHFTYSGMMMVYMQALRFCTDHLNNDIYYGVSYASQNLFRAKNQASLLLRMLEKEDDMNLIVARHATRRIFPQLHP